MLNTSSQMKLHIFNLPFHIPYPPHRPHLHSLQSWKPEYTRKFLKSLLFPRFSILLRCQLPDTLYPQAPKRGCVERVAVKTVRGFRVRFSYPSENDSRRPLFRYRLNDAIASAEHHRRCHFIDGNKEERETRDIYSLRPRQLVPSVQPLAVSLLIDPETDV